MWFICKLKCNIVVADFSEDVHILWSLELPADVVEDSARADVSAVGDLLGPTLQVRNKTFITSFHCCTQKFFELGKIFSSMLGLSLYLLMVDT
jgi:hypothetical protein